MRSHYARATASFALTLVFTMFAVVMGEGASSAAPLQQDSPTPTATAGAAADFNWSRVPTNQISVISGGSATVSGLSLFYQGRSTEASAEFAIFVDGLPNGSRVSVSPSQRFPLTRGSTREITLLISLPSTATGAIIARVTAVKIGVTPEGGTPRELSGAERTQATAFVTLSVTASGSPTVTPNPCPELSDPSDRFENAAVLRVDLEEGHGICRTGDVDWFKFAGVGGKRYTIDIVTMDLGLDLALQLFDERRNLLDANDDYPLRSPATPVITDTEPRINAFLAPRDGTFYIRVYDTLGVGGLNLTYRIVVRSEGYNDPPVVPSLCNDRFEPDGLPQQAQVILANDVHEGHRFCPAGDADWVKFFASRELVYYLYTDTKLPSGAKQPGADTLLYLFSRDGVTLLDSNNNRAIDTSLDSLIVFQPVADGVYYAQIKNVGDVGGNFITYRLTLEACVSREVNCGPPASSGAAPPPSSSPSPSPAASPAASVPEFNLDPVSSP